jgi:hypothetical protein
MGENRGEGGVGAHSVNGLTIINAGGQRSAVFQI